MVKDTTAQFTAATKASLGKPAGDTVEPFQLSRHGKLAGHRFQAQNAEEDIGSAARTSAQTSRRTKGAAIG